MYPFMMNITNKKIVVIGGGKVAAKRVESMLCWHPTITVISPALDARLQVLVKNKQISYEARKFMPSDVTDALIVLAATNDAELNQLVRESCGINQLVNLADDPVNSSFHFPAFHEKNGLTVAVSTSGISPSLAVKLRNDFAAVIDDFPRDYVDFLRDIRKLIKVVDLPRDVKGEILENILDERYHHDVTARTQLREMLVEMSN